MSFPNSAELARNLTTYFIRRFEVAEIDKWEVSKLVASDGVPDPALSADASGYLSSAVQPLFSAYNSAIDLNVTGDATIYTVICDTEIFDVDGNYNNATGIFTASVTGRYLFLAGTDFRGITASHTTGQMDIVTSNRTYVINFLDYAAVVSAAGVLVLSGSIIADMDNGDTSFLNVRVRNGAKVVDVNAGVPTIFQGYLLI